MTLEALRWARRKLASPPASREEARRRKVRAPESDLPSHEDIMRWWEREKLAREAAHVTQTTTQEDASWV